MLSSNLDRFYNQKMEAYQEAIEYSKIQRINWKKILGTTLTSYVKTMRDQGFTKDYITHDILKKCSRNREMLKNWAFQDIVKNVKIGVSARFAEAKIYK